jgi:type I restriction enzyme S subunit
MIDQLPAGWTREKIRSFASIGTGAKDTQDRTPSGKYPFFVRSQKVERIDSWAFDGEAVLTAGDGVGTGKVFHYIKGKFDYHQRVYRISDFRSDVSGKYFFYQFSRNFLARIESLTAKCERSSNLAARDRRKRQRVG